MDTEKNLAAPELAARRPRQAEVTLNAARADVETEAGATSRTGEVAGFRGISPEGLRQPGVGLGEILPR